MPGRYYKRHGTAKQVSSGGLRRCFLRYELLVRKFQSQGIYENETGIQCRTGAALEHRKEPGVANRTEFQPTRMGHPTYKYSRTINYFEIPFFTHIYFGSNRFKFYFNLGPKIGYAFSEKTETNPNETNTNAGSNEQHNMAIQKKFDWGLCGGPGLELRTGIGYFLLEGRYYYALGDIYGSRKSDYFNKSSSQVISARIIYLLPIRK